MNAKEFSMHRLLSDNRLGNRVLIAPLKVTHVIFWLKEALFLPPSIPAGFDILWAVTSRQWHWRVCTEIHRQCKTLRKAAYSFTVYFKMYDSGRDCIVLKDGRSHISFKKVPNNKPVQKLDHKVCSTLILGISASTGLSSRSAAF